MQSDRKLVAIMFTDIVGYTAIMGNNESVAIDVITHYEETIKAKTASFSGEVINFYGDGSLSIFPSVTFAMECAMDIQRELHQGVEVPLRIGIHIGEVLFQRGNIYGDGVNIASRIESLGQPGTILFSEDVFSRISNNPSFEAKLLGSFEFKNVSAPINVYALANEGFPIPPKDTLVGKLKIANDERDEKSIAVLPFENQSNAEDQQFFIDGIADEIRSQLLSINNLKVISRSSCMHFRNKPYTLRDVGKELQVNYALEGRVQVVSDTIKVSVELSNIPIDKQIWSLAPINRKIDDVFILQNTIAQAVASQLEIILTVKEKDQLTKVPTANKDAYILYQKGQDLLHRGYGNPEELKQITAYFEEAIRLDPGFSKAYVGLAEAYVNYVFWGRRKSKDVLEPAMNAALKALELDNSSGECYAALGAVNFLRLNTKISLDFMKKAVALSPGFIGAHEYLAWLNVVDRNMEGTLAMIAKIRELDPLSNKYYGMLGHVHYYTGRFEEGIERLKEEQEKNPDNPFVLWTLGYLQSGAGKYEDAIKTFKARDTTGKNTNWMLAYSYGMIGKEQEAREILNIHLSKRKLDHVPAYMIATIYMGLGETDKVFEWLDKDIDDGVLAFFMMCLKHDPKFYPIKDDSRFARYLEICDRS